VSILPPLTWSDGIAPRFTIGRVGIDVPVDTPAVWNQTGDRVSVAGQLVANSYVGANVLRQQLAAYAAGDGEDVVPVTWEADPSVDGYYRVIGATIGSRPASLFGHFWDFTVELERVDGYRLAAFESIVSAAWGPNMLGRPSTAAKPWVALPAVARDLNRDATTIWRCDDDPAGVALVEIPDVVPPLFARWSVDPADYYVGSARLVSGGAAVVGTQLPDLDPFTFTLSNGIMELRIIGGAPNRGHLATRHRVAAGWSAWKGFRLDVQPPGTDPVLADATAVRVLRNDPAEVVVRVLAVRNLANTAAGTVRHAVDIGLRRGATYATIIAKATPATLWRLYRSATETGAGIAGAEGGIVAAADDADGLRYLILSTLDVEHFTTAGGVQWNTTALSTLTAAIGAVVPPLSSATTENASRTLDRYFTAQAEAVQAIAW